MKIGYDITVLYRAVAGVFNYRRRLLAAMLAAAPQDSFALLDYVPLQLLKPQPPQLAALVQPANAQHVLVNGIRHRKLGHLDIMQHALTEPLAKVADTIFYPLWHYAARESLRRQITRHMAQVDVFHASAVLPFALPHAKNMITIHDLTTLILPQHHVTATQDLHQQTFDFAREEATAVIAVSENTKRDIVRLLGIEPERVHVVYEGVEPHYRPLAAPAVKQVLARYGLTAHDYILHVGTIEPRKNLMRLVAAYALLRERLDKLPPLVLVGRKGWLTDDLYGRIDTLDLTSQIRILDNVPDAALPAFYNGALFLAYPSLYEGFGLPALEAMACGTAVLAANASSLPEVVGDAGVLVDPLDSEAIADGMARLLAGGEAYRAELSQKSLAQSQRFTWEQAARETLQLYQMP